MTNRHEMNIDPTGLDQGMPEDEKTLIVSYGDTCNVYLRSDVNSETINPIVDFIISANLVEPTEENPEEVKLINIFIDSNGGDLHDAFRLIDCMRMSDVPIRTIGWGKVISAGFMIFMAGHERLISRTASVMSHHATFNATFYSQRVTDTSRQKELDNTKNRVIQLYKDYLGHDEKYLKKYLLNDGDIFLTERDVIMHNIADGYLPSKGMKWLHVFPSTEYIKD